MKILQTNLQRKVSAHDAAYVTAKEKGVDILVAAEPNIRTVRGGKWIKDENVDVAVLLINRKVRIHGTTRGRGRVTLDLDAFRLTCCYISPNVGLEVFTQHMEEAFGTVEEGKEAVVLGDINAKSPEWGSPAWDRRGELWTEWLGTKGMEVLNDGKEPTWRRGEQSSYIDVTCATRRVEGKISGWRVLPDESLSDHAFIFFEVGGGRSGSSHTHTSRPVIDGVKLERALRDELSKIIGDTPEMEGVVEALKRAQETSEIRRDGRQTGLPYWWNGEIERARKSCITARRILGRHRRQGNDDEALVRKERDYKEMRRTLARHINVSKRAHWRDLCTELEEDIWGQGYQIVTRAIKGCSTPYELPHETKMEIARQLFPRVDDERPIEEEAEEQIQDFPLFTIEELLEATGKLKRKKSPGPDGVTAETIQEAVKIAPEVLLNMYNGLARRGIFPKRWKKTRLVLIWKGKMPPEAPSSQRPLCLIDVLGKLYEGLIRVRLTKSIEEGEDLSNRQFGFRRGRSTVKAVEYVQSILDEARADRRVKMCALVTLDVRNAFNTARWSLILEEVMRRGVDEYIVRLLRDYLRDRYIGVGRK